MRVPRARCGHGEGGDRGPDMGEKEAPEAVTGRLGRSEIAAGRGGAGAGATPGYRLEPVY